MDTRRSIVLGATLSGALLASPIPAGAMQLDGTGFLQACLTQEETLRGYCLGYIDAVVDGDIGHAPRGQPDYCLPDGIAAQQLRDLAVQWIAGNPSWQGFLASALVTQALRERYPC